MPKSGSINDTTCTGIVLTPTPQTLTVSNAYGGNPGLLGEYFNQRFGDAEVPATAIPDATRLDPQLNFDWPASPIAGLGDDLWTVRWTGWIKPAVTRAYQLCTVSDDGIRVWLDNTEIINDWTVHGATNDCAATPVTLTAGSLYKLRVEFFDNFGNGTAGLSWKHSAAPAGEFIPSNVFLPPGSENQAGGLTISPKFAQFTAQGVPAGCFAGPIRAAWAVDRLDRASVDNFGRVSLFAPLGGDITVSAYAGTFFGDRHRARQRQHSRHR